MVLPIGNRKVHNGKAEVPQVPPDSGSDRQLGRAPVQVVHPEVRGQVGPTHEVGGVGARATSDRPELAPPSPATSARRQGATGGPDGQCPEVRCRLHARLAQGGPVVRGCGHAVGEGNQVERQGLVQVKGPTSVGLFLFGRGHK